MGDWLTVGDWLTIGVMNGNCGRSVVGRVTTSLTVVVLCVVVRCVVLGLRVVDLSVVGLEFSPAAADATRWLISDAMWLAPGPSSSGQQTPGTKRLWKQIDFRKFSNWSSSAGHAVRSRHLPSPPFGVLQGRTSSSGVTSGAFVVVSTLLDSLGSLVSLDSLEWLIDVMIFDGFSEPTSEMVRLNLLVFLIREARVSFPRLNKVDPIRRSSLWRSSTVSTVIPISIRQICYCLNWHFNLDVDNTGEDPIHTRSVSWFIDISFWILCDSKPFL